MKHEFLLLKNQFGWLTTFLAVWLNLANINSFLAVLISLGSLVFIAYKIYGQVLDNRIKKRELKK